MSWLPGWSIFGSHTPVFWLNVLLGGVLGFIATRIRSVGTRFEGERWMLVLGTVAGIVGGATVFLFLGIMTLLFYFIIGRMRLTELIVFSVLGQLALFVYFTLRRDYR